MYGDSMFSDVSQRPRTLTAARVPLSSPELEERDLASIQSVMAQPYPPAPSSRAPHMQFPYDNAQLQPEHVFSNYGAFTARDQIIQEDSSMAYYGERAMSHPFSYKHQLEPMCGQNFNGPFLTQELERLHMTFGTENFIDKNYFFQRELRA